LSTDNQRQCHDYKCNGFKGLKTILLRFRESVILINHFAQLTSTVI